MIEIRGLTKRYRRTVAVDGLSFEVPAGRVTGFLGPNGAGKSTTLRMLLGLARPTAGTARVDGRRYHELRQPLRRVGALLDAGGAHPGRTAYHHLAGLARSNGIALTRVPEVLGLVGLSDVAGRRVGGFSLGMAQRLGVAAAMLGDPPVLVLDEPVNGLDPEGVRWIRGLVRRWGDEGRTVLVSSHLMTEVAASVRHVVVIARGRLVADAPLDELVGGGTDLEDAFLRLTGGGA